MKQVLQDRNGATSVRDVPSPQCPSGGALVEMAFTAISSGTERTRVEVSQKSLLGKAMERPDLVRQVIEKARTEGLQATRAAVKTQLAQEIAIGYSGSGIVVEVGSRSRGIKVGDRVACCGGGHANHAEICAMPGNLMCLVPDEVSMSTASITTIAAIALHGIRLAEPTLGERVAVIGVGLVGQIACRLLSAHGCEVVAIDVDSSKVDYAVANGADHGLLANGETAASVKALTGGRGVDRVIVAAASGDPAPLSLGAAIARDRGSLILVGAVPIEFDRAPLFDKELKFRVSRSYGPGRYDSDYEEHGLDYPIGYVRWTEQRNLEAVLGLLQRGDLFLDDLVEEIVPVEQAETAYAKLVADDHSDRPLGAIVLSYGESINGASASEPEIVEPKAEAARTTPTAGPLRIGLVGPGGFASRILLPAFEKAGSNFELVGGGNGPSAEAAGREKGFHRVADSAQAVCTDPDVDAVVVATRHESHAELSRAALLAGKHTFCEKPLALTTEELDGVIEAAKGSKGVLAVGFNRRFAPMIREVRSHISAVEGPVTATFRVSAGELPPDHWTQDLEQGGGRLLGEGCHFIDTLRYLVGHRIETVSAIAHGSPDTPVQAQDCLLVNMTFADGSIGQVTYVSQGSPKVGKERLEIFAGGGRSAIMDNYQSLELYDGLKVNRTTSKSPDKGHQGEVSAFVDAARGKPDSSPVPLAEVANVSYATLAAVRSLETGVPVRLALIE